MRTMIASRSVPPFRSALPALGLALAFLAGAAAADGAADPADPPPAPEDMVLIPAGTFLMGSDGDEDHSPAHEVRLGAFWL